MHVERPDDGRKPGTLKPNAARLITLARDAHVRRRGGQQILQRGPAGSRADVTSASPSRAATFLAETAATASSA